MPYPQVIRGTNLFTADPFMQDILNLSDPRWYATLADFGQWVGGWCDEQAEYTDRFGKPELRAFNKNAQRVNEIVHNPAWVQASRSVYEKGVVGLNYGESPEHPGTKAPYLLTFAMGYLLSQADVSLHCPVTMTGAVAYVLDRFAPEKVRKTYLKQLTRQDGKALSGGTWATELHGGSDIGATTTVAEAIEGVPGEVRLTGLKWFTSNANGGIALATARPRGENAPGSKGLGAYLVPTHMADGSPNPMLIRRLKDKLGTCGVPTGEIDLMGTWAVEVAPPPTGFKLMMEALSFSRIHNAMGSAGIQRRAFIEAMAFSTHRTAFGHTITDYPMVQTEAMHILAPLWAGSLLAFGAAEAFDEAHAIDVADAHNPKRVWLRLMTALAKYLTAEDAIKAASRAIEMIGGNGYVYDHITPRLLRDAQVLTVWEGPANIQALEMLRLLAPELGGFALFDARLAQVLESLPKGLQKAAGADLAAPLAEARKACQKAATAMAKDPALAQREARRLLALMAKTMAYGLLVEKAGKDLENTPVTAHVARFYAERELAPAAFDGVGHNDGWLEKAFPGILAATWQ